MKLHRFLNLATLLLPAGLSLAFCACSGCSTLKAAPARLLVQVKDADHFDVEGKIVSLGELPRAVKKTGARPETEIMMQLPSGFPQKTLLPAYAALQRAGYKKTFFTGPREVTTQVGEQPLPPGNKKTPIRK